MLRVRAEPSDRWLLAQLTIEQGTNLRLPKAPVSARGADAADAAGRRPARHRLRIHPEQRCHFSRSEKTISRVHNPSQLRSRAAKSVIIEASGPLQHRPCGVSEEHGNSTGLGGSGLKLGYFSWTPSIVGVDSELFIVLRTASSPSLRMVGTNRPAVAAPPEGTPLDG